LVKNFYLLTGYTTRKLPKEFPGKSWNERRLQETLKNLSIDTGSVDRRPGSGQTVNAKTVVLLATSCSAGTYTRHPQTHQSVLEMLKITGIRRSSVGRTIHELLKATNPEENKVPIRLLTYSRLV